MQSPENHSHDNQRYHHPWVWRGPLETQSPKTPLVTSARQKKLNRQTSNTEGGLRRKCRSNGNGSKSCTRNCECKNGLTDRRASQKVQSAQPGNDRTSRQEKQRYNMGGDQQHIEKGTHRPQPNLPHIRIGSTCNNRPTNVNDSIGRQLCSVTNSSSSVY